MGRECSWVWGGGFVWVVRVLGALHGGAEYSLFKSRAQAIWTLEWFARHAATMSAVKQPTLRAEGHDDDDKAR